MGEGGRPRALRSLSVAAAACAVAATPGAFAVLVCSREGVLRGEVWRILTGHFVHSGTTHLLWDVVPLVLVGLLFEGELGRRFWAVLAGAALAVGAGVVLLLPELPSYCGLSGVINGIWVAGALVASRAESDAGRPGLARLYLVCVLLDLGKVAFEAAAGSPLFTDPAALGSVPVPLAHALGALGGVAALRLTACRPGGIAV